MADPRRYVEKILESYQTMFGEVPQKVRTPLIPSDHPGIDTTEFCGQEEIKHFQTLIGQLQWLITWGRFDIVVFVIFLSRISAQPRKGHLERAKRIVGYLSSQPEGAIRFRTGEPDYLDLPYQDYDWTRTVYGAAKEHIPKDIPNPKGKRVITTTYVDANLHHDLTTGKSVTAVLHFINSTPGDWFSKRQASDERATCGSKFVAVMTAVDQIIDLTHVPWCSCLLQKLPFW